MSRKTVRFLIAALLVFAALGVFLIFKGASGGQSKNAAAVSESSVSVGDAPFTLKCPDRMDGLFLVGESYDGSIYEASYSDGSGRGFIRNNSGVAVNFPEQTEHNIDGVTVTFKGRDGKVNLAQWENNNLVYSIGIRVEGEGAAPEDMTEYVKAIR